MDVSAESTEIGWQTLSYLVFGVLCDVLVFGASIVDARSPKFAVRSESFVEVFTRLVIETNALGAICSILSLSFMLAYNNQGRPSGIWMAFALVLPKIYVLSLLASHTHAAEMTRLTVDYTKHNSSLSDMFKGKPTTPERKVVTVSKIGSPQTATMQKNGNTPIANLYSNNDPESPGWLRRTIQAVPTIKRQESVRDVPPMPTHNLINQNTGLAPPKPAFARTSSAGLSVSDYGEFLAEDPDPLVPSHDGHAAPVHAGHSTAVEVSLSPRRTHFADPISGPMSKRLEVGETIVPFSCMGLNIAGKPPVTYGYL
ncbi:DUF6534 domain-containing protein [Sporobolomyces koalae]|uniref:DUF6534 domain-containing protein n=1 Tax=Sporobolomyces koalae TaxID=500713 RepID=UPI00317DBC34